MWCVNCVLENGGTPMARFTKRRSDFKLQMSDPGVGDYEATAMAIEKATCYDQVSCPNLAAFQMLARRLQMTEEKY